MLTQSLLVSAKTDSLEPCSSPWAEAILPQRVLAWMKGYLGEPEPKLETIKEFIAEAIAAKAIITDRLKTEHERTANETHA